jgi:hypothetical protein
MGRLIDYNRLVIPNVAEGSILAFAHGVHFIGAFACWVCTTFFSEA